MASRQTHQLATSLIIMSFLICGIAQDPDITTQTHPCNTCCQGPSGLPGIPGSSGHNGLPGRDGIKGDKGDIGSPGVGDIGPSGPRGPVGEKGEIGGIGLRGLPGKVGPRGERGDAGIDGTNGFDGSKGQKGAAGARGDKGDSGRTRRSAFTATKESDQTGDVDDVLTFQRVETNIGSDFNLGTSKFTCEVPGVYWFTFTICNNQATHDPKISLVKNGSYINKIYFHNADDQSKVSQLTNGAVLQLEAGDQIWLEFHHLSGQRVHGNSNRLTTFSGFLLYED